MVAYLSVNHEKVVTKSLHMKPRKMIILRSVAFTCPKDCAGCAIEIALGKQRDCTSTAQQGSYFWQPWIAGIQRVKHASEKIPVPSSVGCQVPSFPIAVLATTSQPRVCLRAHQQMLISVCLQYTTPAQTYPQMPIIPVSPYFSMETEINTV